MGALIFVFYNLLFASLTIKHYSYALIALICMFAIEQWGAIYVPFIAENGTIVNIAILSLVIFSWFRLPTGASVEFLQYPIRLTFILLFGYAFLSTTWAPADVGSMGRYIKLLPYNATMLLIAPLLLRRSEDVTKMLDALTYVGGLLVILLAFMPDFSGRSLVSEIDFLEAVYLPLALSDFSASIMILCIIRLTPKPLDTLWKIAVTGSAVFLMVKTGSRGQLLFSFVVTLLCIPIRWRKFTINKFLVYVLLGVVLAITLAIILNTDNTISKRFSGEGLVAGSLKRIDLVAALMETWSEGTLLTLIFGLGSSASWSTTISGYHPHNVPLEILGELGLLGFTMFSVIVISMFLMAFSRGPRANISDRSAIDFAALFGCWLVAFMISCKQSAFIGTPDLLMYAVLAEKSIRLGQRDNRIKKKIKALRKKHRMSKRLITRKSI